MQLLLAEEVARAVSSCGQTAVTIATTIVTMSGIDVSRVARPTNTRVPPTNSTVEEKTTARTANGPDDGDSAWVETIDIDGDGNPEVTDLMWDDEDKMLFLHAGDLFACKNGGTGEGDGSTARAIRVGAPLARDSSS